MILWILLSLLLGFPVCIDLLLILASIVPIVLLHELMHSIPLLIWRMKFRPVLIPPGIKMEDIGSSHYALVMIMPSFLQLILLIKLSSFFLSMYLVNSIGMGADLYAFLLLIGTNARVRDEGDHIIISGAPEVERRRKILSPLCCSVFYSSVLTIALFPLELLMKIPPAFLFVLLIVSMWIFRLKREKQKIS
jgi:hypothetical protein